MLKAILLLAVFHIMLFLTTRSKDLNAQTASEYTQIMTRYEQWKALEYKNGNYEIPSKCKVEIVTKDSYKGPNVGIPKDIQVSFTDINGDKKMDALITFSPEQCDGGNALMNSEERVLILSKGAAYVTDNAFFTKIEDGLEKGWLHITSASFGQFYGTYFEYKDDDGRCCPSIKKDFYIDYKTKKLEYLGE